MGLALRADPACLTPVVPKKLISLCEFHCVKIEHPWSHTSEPEQLVRVLQNSMYTHKPSLGPVTADKSIFVVLPLHVDSLHTGGFSIPLAPVDAPYIPTEDNLVHYGYNFPNYLSVPLILLHWGWACH